MPLLRCLLAGLVALMFSSVAGAELPSAEEILQVHRANRAKLSHLHLQLVQTEEATDAEAVERNKSADKELVFIDALKEALKGKVEELELMVDGKTIKGEEAKAMMTQIVANHQVNFVRNQRGKRSAFQMFTPVEFFFDGDDYQFRQSSNHFKTREELAEYQFSAVPLTEESLPASYRKTMIFSRSHETTPPSRWWHCGSVTNAYIMQKHLCEVSHIHLPPFTDPTTSRWDSRHAYDHFFSQPADKYRVIRQEQIGGHLLTVVDVEVPIGEGGKALLCYRAWLDLKRGATPIKLYHSQGIAGKFVAGGSDWREPYETVVTHEVRELANGAFYPSNVVLEQWGKDPEAPALTADDLLAGKRPARAVHRRRSWECSIVDTEIKFAPGFFVLPFSADEPIFDHDAGKMIGALDRQPVPKVGEPAPPLTIGHWLDGQPRTLDDLQGQVVVLDFWGLWCGACKAEVPAQKIIQEKFRDQPVVFIAIHTAETKPDKLAERIQAFQKEQGWTAIAAIDSGRMLEDSVTTTAYGVDHFPFQVIIGPDGKIVYIDPAADGPACNETDPAVMAKFEETFKEYWALRFKAVGEEWPLKEDLDEKTQQEIYERVQREYLIKVIEGALPKT